MSLRTPEVQAMAVSALGSTFGWKVRPTFVTAPEQDAVRIGSSVHVVGRWHGEIVVFLSPKLARRAAKKLFAKRIGLRDHHIHEAVRQVTGQISGDILDQLPRPCEMHVPAPVMIGGGAIRRANISALLQCDGEPCWVLLDGPEVEEITEPIEPSRRFSRADVRLGVTVSSADKIHRSMGPTNLSMNGVFVRGEPNIPLGQDCVVTVHASPRDEDSVRVAGRVARITPEGFAVEFLEVDMENYQQLRDIVQDHAPSPPSTDVREA